MAIATGCVVAGAILTSSAGRQVMTSAASNTAQHILGMIIGTSNVKEHNQFLSSRIQAKLECILHLFNTMQKVFEKQKKSLEASGKDKEEQSDDDESYERTMWNRVFREMSMIQTVVAKMKKEQEDDSKSWVRRYWPRSQTDKQIIVMRHLETIEEIIRFVSMVTPYIHSNKSATKMT